MGMSVPGFIAVTGRGQVKMMLNLAHVVSIEQTDAGTQFTMADGRVKTLVGLDWDQLKDVVL